jgi:hypothetical protein
MFLAWILNIDNIKLELVLKKIISRSLHREKAGQHRLPDFR